MLHRCETCFASPAAAYRSREDGEGTDANRIRVVGIRAGKRRADGVRSRIDGRCRVARRVGDLHPARDAGPIDARDAY